MIAKELWLKLEDLYSNEAVVEEYKRENNSCNLDVNYQDQEDENEDGEKGIMDEEVNSIEYLAQDFNKHKGNNPLENSVCNKLENDASCSYC